MMIIMIMGHYKGCGTKKAIPRPSKRWQTGGWTSCTPEGWFNLLLCFSLISLILSLHVIACEGKSWILCNRWKKIQFQTLHNVMIFIFVYSFISPEMARWSWGPPECNPCFNWGCQGCWQGHSWAKWQADRYGIPCSCPWCVCCGPHLPTEERRKGFGFYSPDTFSSHVARRQLKF